MQSKLANVSQRFTTLSQTGDKVQATVVASCAEVSCRANDIAVRLVQAIAYIHFAMSFDYVPIDKPSEL